MGKWLARLPNPMFMYCNNEVGYFAKHYYKPSLIVLLMMGYDNSRPEDSTPVALYSVHWSIMTEDGKRSPEKL